MNFLVCSSFASVGVGGVVSIFPKPHCSVDGMFASESVIQGRALRVAYTSEATTLIHWNIHNFGITGANLSLLLGRIRRDLELAADNPDSVLVVLAGDFNLLARGETQTRLSRPVPPSESIGVIHQASPWDSIFGGLTELKHGADTHYTPSSDSSSRIDRIFISSPPWVILQIEPHLKLWAEPKMLHEQGISDHAPFSGTFTGKPPPPQKNQPISKSIAGSQRFKEACKLLCDKPSLRT